MTKNRLFLILAVTAGLVLIPTTTQAEDCSDHTPVAASKDIVDTAVGAGSFKTLVAAVKAAGLVETLKGEGPFTVFAPTDAAFAKLPKGAVEALLKDKEALKAVLTYHVVPGKLPAAKVLGSSWLKTAQGQSLFVNATEKGAMIDGAKIVATDIATSNGIIHVIDTVVLPRKDIVDTAVGAGSFKTLVAAVKAAKLVETLKGKGPFTVFAPTDAAFAKLPKGTVEGLLKDLPTLKAILTYHVVPGRVLARDITMGTIEVKTAEGRSLRIERNKDGVMINGAKVILKDVIAGNGVIHVIDTVVIPSAQ